MDSRNNTQMPGCALVRFGWAGFLYGSTRSLLPSLGALVILVLSPVYGLAELNDTWDWKIDPNSGKPKRTLTIVFDTSVADFKDKTGIDLKDVIQEAAGTLNTSKNETGWELIVDKTGKNGDIVITGKKSDVLDGGATTTRTFDGPVAGGAVKGATINFDPTPRGKKRDASGNVLRDPVTGKPLAEELTWGTSGADKLDPITVAEHELIHTERKKHSKDATGKEPKDTGNLFSPVSKGNHQRTPSDADKNDLKASNAAPVKTATQTVEPGKDHNINVPLTDTAGASLFVPSSALFAPTTLSVTPLEGLPLPFPDSLFPDIPRIALGLELDTEGPQLEFREPLQATLFYDAAIWTNPDFGPIDTNTLQAFRFDPLSQVWETVPLLANHPVENSITFPLNDPNFKFYGVGGLEVTVIASEPSTVGILSTGLLIWVLGHIWKMAHKNS